MLLELFLKLIFGAYLSFLIFVLPVVDGILWAQRFRNKRNKVFLGMLYAILTGGFKCIVFYFLLFLVFPFDDLTSGESSLIREIIFQFLVLAVCSYVTCLSYSWGKKKKLVTGISELIRSLNRYRSRLAALMCYLICAGLFSLGFSLLLRMVVKISDEFVFIDVWYFLELLILLVISVLLFLAGSAVFLKTRTRYDKGEFANDMDPTNGCDSK